MQALLQQVARVHVTSLGVRVNRQPQQAATAGLGRSWIHKNAERRRAGVDATRLVVTSRPSADPREAWLRFTFDSNGNMVDSRYGAAAAIIVEDGATPPRKIRKKRAREARPSR
jgi:hypothetical protein